MLYAQRIKTVNVNVERCQVKQEVCFVSATERQLIEELVERCGWYIGGDGSLNPGNDSSIRIAARIDTALRRDAFQPTHRSTRDGSCVRAISDPSDALGFLVENEDGERFMTEAADWEAIR